MASIPSSNVTVFSFTSRGYHHVRRVVWLGVTFASVIRIWGVPLIQGTVKFQEPASHEHTHVLKDMPENVMCFLVKQFHSMVQSRRATAENLAHTFTIC